jgi:hypothetical protein
LNPLDFVKQAEAFRARKKPVRVSVTFAATDGVCLTREGQVSYRRGDAVVTGTEGEQWPVRADRFSELYRPVPPTTFGSDGDYSSVSRDVLAWRLDTALMVRIGSSRDRLHGAAGDWLLQYEDGAYGIVSPEIFESTYELSPTEHGGSVA